MLIRATSRRRYGAIAAACLLTVSLPATAWAQKTKNQPEAATEAETDADIGAETDASAVLSDVSVDIPAIESIGSNVDEAVLRDIFSGNVVDNADALAGLTAESITIPEITIDASTTVDGDAMSVLLTFENLVLSDVDSGVAGSVSIGGFNFTSDDGNGEFGAMTASQFDIGGVLGLYGLVADSGEQTLETIYTDFNFAGGTINSDELNCTIGTVTAAEFKARPLQYSFADIAALAKTMEEQDAQPSPEAVGEAMRMYVDLLTSFETSPVVFGGFDCSGVDDEQRPVTFSVAGMNVGGMSPGLYPEISMTGIDIDVENDGKVSVGSVLVKAMDLSGPIAAIQNAPEAIEPSWFEENARALIPAFGGFTVSDIDVDVPDIENPGERIVGGIGNFDLTLENYINGIPASASTRAENIVFNIPADTADPQLQQLAAYGITNIDAGFALQTTWNEADDTISIDELSLTGANLADVVVSGTIANATEALFSADENEAMAAAMSIALFDLNVDVTDTGLYDIILSQIAAEQGSDPDTLRPVFAGLAEGTIVGMLAGAADAQQVGGAVSAFVSGQAKQLVINITAKEAPGLSLDDFTAAEEDPTSLIGKVNIDASAN